MKIYQALEQGTEEWLKVRVGKFGGTDAYTVSVNGKGLETLCFQKASEIIVGRPAETYKNADMERGNLMESTARTAYKMRDNCTVQEVGYVELDSWVGVSPDGLVNDDGLLEIKCPNDYKFVKFLYEKRTLGLKAIEKQYYWQMQHQMYVTDRKWCDYVIFNDNLDQIDVTRIARHEADIEKLKKGLLAGVEKVKNILEAFNGR